MLGKGVQNSILATFGQYLPALAPDQIANPYGIARERLATTDWDKFDRKAQLPISAGRVSSAHKTRIAMEQVLDLYESNNRKPPSYLIKPAGGRDDLYSSAELVALCADKVERAYVVSQDCLKVEEHKRWVHEYRIHGERRIFRPIQADQADHEAARFSFVAAGLDRFMGFDTTPQAWFAQIAGVLGVLTEYCEGEVAEALEAAHADLDIESLSNNILFHFLINNDDVYPENAWVSKNRKLKVFDFDCAFYNRFYQSPSPTGIGMHLPTTYAPEAVAGLLKFQPANLRELAIYQFMHPSELEMLLFNRDVLLLHAVSVLTNENDDGMI